MTVTETINFYLTKIGRIRAQRNMSLEKYRGMGLKERTIKPKSMTYQGKAVTGQLDNKSQFILICENEEILLALWQRFMSIHLDLNGIQNVIVARKEGEILDS